MGIAQDISQSTQASISPSATPKFATNCSLQQGVAQTISTQSHLKGSKPPQQLDMQQASAQHANPPKEALDNDQELYEHIQGSVRFNYPREELLPSYEPKEDLDYIDFLRVFL